MSLCCTRLLPVGILVAVAVALLDRWSKALGQFASYWDPERVYVALCASECCLANDHPPEYCSDEPITDGGLTFGSSDGALNAAMIRADLGLAYTRMIDHMRRDWRARNELHEAVTLIEALKSRGCRTATGLVDPDELSRAQEIARRGGLDVLHPQSVTWVQWESRYWDDVSRKLRLATWQEAEHRARYWCVAMARHLGWRGDEGEIVWESAA